MHNNREVIKINTLLRTNILLSQTTEVTLQHTPQLHIHNKALPTLSRAKRHTNPLPLSLRTGPRKRILINLRTARIETVTSKMAYQAPMERRVSEQHLLEERAADLLAIKLEAEL